MPPTAPFHSSTMPPGKKEGQKPAPARPSENGVRPLPPGSSGSIGPDISRGQTLINEGIITTEEIRSRLHAAEGNPNFIRLLLYCPMISAWELAAILAARHQVPVLNLDAMDVPRSVLNLLSPQQAYELEVLPVARLGDIVCIAMQDIRDSERVRKVRTALKGMRVKVFPCPIQQIRRHLVRYYVFPGAATSAQASGGSSEMAEAPPTILYPNEARQPVDSSGRAIARPPGPKALKGDVEEAPPTIVSFRPDASPSGSGMGPVKVSSAIFRQLKTKMPPGFSPAADTEEFKVEEEDTDDLLATVEDIDRPETNSHFLRAEAVSELEGQDIASNGEEFLVHAWERNHFSHSPILAERVELGFPAE